MLYVISTIQRGGMDVSENAEDFMSAKSNQREINKTFE